MKAKSSVAVVYLARKSNGVASWQSFLDSYTNLSAGIGHQLVIVYKGFEGDGAGLMLAQKLFSEVESEAIFVTDQCLDIGAYLQAAHQIDSHYVCFLNTHSVINGPNWLLFLTNAISVPEIGLAGATGSYESLYDSLALISKVNWLIYVKKIPYNKILADHFAFILNAPDNIINPITNTWKGNDVKRTIWQAMKERLLGPSPMIRQHREVTESFYDESSISHLEAEWLPYWDHLVSKVGAFNWLPRIPRFPNPHIRSNAFIIEREFLIKFFPFINSNKQSAYEFESGFSGLSKTVLSQELSLAIVNSHGQCFLQDEWAKSKTFRLQDQERLLIKDNQTTAFMLMEPRVRDIHIMMSWGRAEVAGKSTPSLGLPFNAISK